MYITGTAEQTLHRFLNVGVEMNGINEVGIRVRLCKSAQRLTDVLETRTKVLPSMPGYKNAFLSHHSRVKPGLRQRGLHLHTQFSGLVYLVDYPLQSINNRITRYGNCSGVNLLTK